MQRQVIKFSRLSTLAARIEQVSVPGSTGCTGQTEMLRVQAQQAALSPCAFPSMQLSMARGFAADPPKGSAASAPFDEEHVSIANEINKLLLMAGESSNIALLFQTVESNLDYMDETAIRTAFEQIERIEETAPMAQKKEIHEHPMFQALVDLVIMEARKLTPGALAGIASACAALDFKDDMLMDKLAQFMVRKIESSSAEDIVEMAKGFASSDYAPSVVLFEVLKGRAATLSKSLSSQQTASLKKAFVDLGYNDSGL